MTRGPEARPPVGREGQARGPARGRQPTRGPAGGRRSSGPDRRPGRAGVQPPSAGAGLRDRRRLPYLAAIGLSALLLFTTELLAGRLILPVFGGTPGVWATTLSFFTAMLFVGYLYAHLLATRASPRWGATLHLALAVAAVGATIVGPREMATLRSPDLPEALNVLLVQGLTWGPAAFLLASTTPLLSAWYARRWTDPWWLYAVSNAASLAALLAYPFIIEPLVGLAAQRLLVTIGLGVFAATIGWIVLRGGVAARREPPGQPEPGRSDPPTDSPPGPPPGPQRIGLWLLAAFVPAGLLSATTNFITTDLLSAPLLWIGPLAIYLATFMLAFSERGRRALGAAEMLAPASAVLLWTPWLSPEDWPALGVILVELGAFLVIALAIHGRLALARPEPGHLTLFYLVISAGGMLATAFVALLAPVVFPVIYEYPLLVVLAIVVLGLLPGPRQSPLPRTLPALLRGAAVRVAPLVVAGALLLGIVALSDDTKLVGFVQLLAIAAVVVAVGVRPLLLAAASLATIAILLGIGRSYFILEERTFFGVLRVGADEQAHAEFSGTTLHGFQFLDATRRGIPTTYYAAEGPLGQIIDDARSRQASLRIGVVGLGVGTTAAYARPGDTLTFFEIDPAAVAIARNTAYFTYLADAAVTPRIVVGDARLSLAREPAASFDILILDAFSSDAVPTHLLTREAIADDIRTLRPGGLLLFHVTNRYYRLESAVVATAEADGLGALVRTWQPTEDQLVSRAAVPSTWVLAGTRAEVPPYRGLGWGDPGPGPVLTDDFADVLRLLKPLG